MAVVDELIIALGVRTDGASFRRASSAIEGVMQGAVNLGAAVGAAVTALFGVAKATADYVDEATDAAAAIGMEAGALVELRWAMARATGSAEGLEGALRILSRTTQDALDGGEASAKAFARLGISVDQLRGKSPDEVLSLVAEGMRGIESPTERTALAMDVLGRSGAALVPMLVEGADGIEAMRQRARDLGVTISEEASAEAGEFNDTLDDLTALGTGLVRKIGEGVIPVFTRWGKKILDLWAANKEIINQRLEVAIEMITAALSALEGPLGVVVGLMSALAAVRAAGSILAAAQAIPILGTAIAGTTAALGPFLLAIGAVVAAVAVIEDFYGFAIGKPSLIELVLGKLGVSDERITQLQLMALYTVDLVAALERLARLELGKAVALLFDPEAGAKIAASEAFIPDTGLTSVNWARGIEAERLDAARRMADPTSMESQVAGAIVRQAASSYNITIASAFTAYDIASAVREAIHQTHRESADQYGAP